MPEDSILSPGQSRRGRAGGLAAAAFLAVAALASASAIGAPATTARQAAVQGCHDFNRFGERWELCRDATGSTERHRLGLLP